ncbi:MAG: Nif11-like leader peptide family natural product precursor [Cyanobacteriota bacterium]|nr:Nif11-like leader peptide family natural product precursor [Cyanobacteriota bacterium]
MITHVKLFMDGGLRQVALFSGPDEQTQWLRNCPAEELLSHGWHLLPKEELISIQDVEVQGFLNPGALADPRTALQPPSESEGAASDDALSDDAQSDDALKAFLAKVSEDSALQAKLKGASTIEGLQEIAREAGFTVSTNQLSRARTMGEDLLTSGGGWLLWCMLANFMLNSASNSLTLTLRK